MTRVLCRERLDTVPEDASELSFGNSVYKIRFEDRDERPLYGHRYWFFLKDAVEDVPEYVVHWETFVKSDPSRPLIHFEANLLHSRMAAEYDLDLVYEKEFHEVYAENEEHAEFGPMLQHMKVVDSNGESQMDEDQWEAASTCHLSGLHLDFANGPHQIFILRLHSRSALDDRLDVDVPSVLSLKASADLAWLHIEAILRVLPAATNTTPRLVV